MDDDSSQRTVPSSKRGRYAQWSNDEISFSAKSVLVDGRSKKAVARPMQFRLPCQTVQICVKRVLVDGAVMKCSTGHRFYTREKAAGKDWLIGSLKRHPGDVMSMECRTDEESRVRRWELSKTIKGETFNIYTHGNPTPFHEKFTHFAALVNANGSGILYTNSTMINDAGLYACVTRSPDDSTVKVAAQLTVFESRPICETNLTANGNKSLEDDYVSFRCNVSFRGFWAPTMEWRQHSGTGYMGRSLTDGIETLRLSDTNVISTLTIKVNLSMKGVFFSCKTYFTEYDGQFFVDSANNTPNYNYTWNSEAVELPNQSVSGSNRPSDGDEPTSSSDWPLLVAGLSVFLILLAILAVVLGVQYKERIIVPKRVKPDVVQHEFPNIQLSSYATYAEVTFTQPEERKTETKRLPEAREVQPGYSPTYAKVMKVNGPKSSVGNNQTDVGAETEIHQPSKTYTGDDGTQYTEVKKFTDRNSRVPVSNPPMFSLVETYASIDHTLDVSGPPLPARSHRPI